MMRRNSRKLARNHTNPLIRRATEVMRTHPSFRRLNKEWASLLLLQRAKLMRQILRAAPGNENQRALARLLWRHIKDESSIRYYLRKLAAHEQSRRGNRPRPPLQSGAEEAKGPEERPSGSGQPPVTISSPPAPVSLPAVASPPPNPGPDQPQGAASSCPPPATDSASGSLSEAAVDLNKIADEVVTRIKKVSPNASIALLNLNSVRQQLRSRSAVTTGAASAGSPVRSSASDKVKVKDHGDADDPLHALADWILAECKGSENGLKTVELAEKSFKEENSFWYRRPGPEEQEARRKEWDREREKMHPQQPRKVPPPTSSRTLW